MITETILSVLCFRENKVSRLNASPEGNYFKATAGGHLYHCSTDTRCVSHLRPCATKLKLIQYGSLGTSNFESNRQVGTMSESSGLQIIFERPIIVALYQNKQTLINKLKN